MQYATYHKSLLQSFRTPILLEYLSLKRRTPCTTSRSWELMAMNRFRGLESRVIGFSFLGFWSLGSWVWGACVGHHLHFVRNPLYCTKLTQKSCRLRLLCRCVFAVGARVIGNATLHRLYADSSPRNLPCLFRAAVRELQGSKFQTWGSFAFVFFSAAIGPKAYKGFIVVRGPKTTHLNTRRP